MESVTFDFDGNATTTDTTQTVIVERGEFTPTGETTPQDEHEFYYSTDGSLTFLGGTSTMNGNTIVYGENWTIISGGGGGTPTDTFTVIPDTNPDDMVVATFNMGQPSQVITVTLNDTNGDDEVDQIVFPGVAGMPEEAFALTWSDLSWTATSATKTMSGTATFGTGGIETVTIASWPQPTGGGSTYINWTSNEAGEATVAGDDVEIKVHFSSNVIVNTMNGTPTLSLDIYDDAGMSHTVQANFVQYTGVGAGQSQTSMMFVYTAAAADVGTFHIGNIDLNSGSITGVSDSLAVNLTLDSTNRTITVGSYLYGDMLTTGTSISGNDAIGVYEINPTLVQVTDGQYVVSTETGSYSVTGNDGDRDILGVPVLLPGSVTTAEVANTYHLEYDSATQTIKAIASDGSTAATVPVATATFSLGVEMFSYHIKYYDGSAYHDTDTNDLLLAGEVVTYTDAAATNEHFVRGSLNADDIDLSIDADAAARYTVHGGAGDDTITGSAGKDAILGDGGANTINAGAGDDNIFIANNGVGTTADGGTGTDKLVFELDGQQMAFGGRIMGPAILSQIGTGQDGFVADPALATNAYRLDTSDDGAIIVMDYTTLETLMTATNVEALQFRFEQSDGRMGVPLQFGTADADTLTSTTGMELLSGGAGDDVLNASGIGNDVLLGGSGNDTLNGGVMHDKLYGGAGNDVLNAGGSNDWLVGGTGNDTLNGGGGTNDSAGFFVHAFGATTPIVSTYDSSIGGFKVSQGSVDLAQIVWNEATNNWTVSDLGDPTVSGFGIDTVSNVEFLKFDYDAGGSLPLEVDMAILASQVGGGTDNIAPELLSATVNGATLTLTYSETLDETSIPLAGDFAVGTGAPPPLVPSSVAVSGATVTLTLPTAVAAGATVTLGYSGMAIRDIAGNGAVLLSNEGVSNTTSASTDMTAPGIVGATFTEGANSSITVTFSEALTVDANRVIGLTPDNQMVDTAGFSFSKLDTASGNHTPIELTNVSMNGSATVLTFFTTSTLGSGDVVNAHHNASFGSLSDGAGNRVPSNEVWFGGSGISTIDLDGYIPDSPIQIRGNAGDDRLVGTNADDTLIDGRGADTITGSLGSDTIVLVENSTSGYFRDEIVIEPGESVGTTRDVIVGSATSPDTTGFDIASADPGNHDVLRLPASIIAADTVGISDGFDINGILAHSITNGIATFHGADNTTLAVVLSDPTAGKVTSSDAVAYLSANITQQGHTVGFKVDTNNDNVLDDHDALVIFQDAGMVADIPQPDTVVALSGQSGYGLIGLATATLGNAAGDHVVQIIGPADNPPPGDITAPVFTSATTATVVENTAASVTVYDATADGDSGVTYTIGGTDGLLFSINSSTGDVAFTASPDYETPADSGPNNVYDFTVTATDLAQNATTQAVALTVTDLVETGQAVIDLGEFGKLIAPAYVDGNWYYYWDRSGDGTNADNTGPLNGGMDFTTHDVLDGIFNQDINGNTGGGGNTTETYRYATLNGIQLALPTLGEGTVTTGFRPGTAIDNDPAGEANATYNDLLAIWDGYNGATTGTNIFGTPSAWKSHMYWSATPSATGYAAVDSSYGMVVDLSDNSSTFAYVALQVLGSGGPAEPPPPSDTTRPTSVGASFVTNTNTITLNFDEVVTLDSSYNLTLHLNPNLADGNGGWSSPSLNVSIAGSDTSTLTLTTDATFAATDVVRLSYNFGVADSSGNQLSSLEVWIGGAGNNTIDLDDYGSMSPVVLRGNGGSDTLTGTNAADVLIDGGGADVLTGGEGADTIVLVENGGTVPYSSDVVFIQPGDSIVGTRDLVKGSATSPTNTGFDIASSNASLHDQLSLPSAVIAGDSGTVAGIVYNGIAQHSIASGIVTFYNASGLALGVVFDDTDAVAGTSVTSTDGVSYLVANIDNVGATVAFKVDSDKNASLDSLVIFQDTGSIIPDTLITLSGLIGIDQAVLGNAAGPNVVQIVDTQAPETISESLGPTGMVLSFAENVYADDSLALSFKLNGTTDILKSVSGSGTDTLTITPSFLSQPDGTEWLLGTFSPTSAANSFADVNDNYDNEPGVFAQGLWGNNSIDLSAYGPNNGSGYDMNGDAGNDTLTGSAYDDHVMGGSGADTMTGGTGNDDFGFKQGDSPEVIWTDLNNEGAGFFSNGDTLSFTQGADIITDFSQGDGIWLDLPPPSGPHYMGYGDSSFGALPGTYDAGTGVFTVDYEQTTTTTPRDTVLIYDGNPTVGEALMTGVVLSGIYMYDINTVSGSTITY
ncbi:MAG: SwmB domain-containing protein [Sulfuritalea sp.]|nr:SwmB domain-containing protein [Sulfuritalea sp.]